MTESIIKGNPLAKYFEVAVRGQSYMNLFYLLLSFPLGVLYFMFLVTGLSLGLSLAIVWVGIPILAFVALSWWSLASVERWMAVTWLNENIPPMTLPSDEGKYLFERLREFFTNPITWNSLLYLILKFPLGIFSFTILVTLVSLVLSFLAMPVLYQVGGITNAGINLGSGWVWQINSLGDAFIIAIVGVFLLPAALHVCNGVTLLHSRMARLLFGGKRLGNPPAV
jgi:hypothetical protein